MDRTPYASDAEAAPPAAEPQIDIQETIPGRLSGRSVPAPEFAPVVTEPAPDAAAAPAVVEEPRFDPQAVYAMAEQNRQYQQAMQQLQQLAAQQEAQRQEQETNARFTSQRDAIYQTANQMAPEDAAQFIRRNEDQLHAAYDQRIRQIQEMAQRQMYETVAQVAAPRYASELAKQHGLPAEYAERLAMLPPQQMDAYLPALKREWQDNQKAQGQYQDLLKKFDQLSRSQQAQQIAAGGAHVAGGVGATPLAADGSAPAAGSREHLLAIAGHLFR